ncbi:MAG: orotidine-5'-phosphate decarboxylase [Chloroflexi bacterium]|nr:orotidine-5'-phosphate decarboxylase [Chloroflexota bacterium]
MSKPFFKQLEERVLSVNSLLCVGLDPHPGFLSQNNAAGARDFCFRIIEETAEVACAFKPNSAFFEAFGADGIKVLGDVIRAVPDGIPVILDAKRGDIASTAMAYAKAAFQVLGADALTINPYLGWDSVEPMIASPQHACFLLCKTSNPGSDDFQNQILESGEPLYIHFARHVAEKGTAGNVGLVVGATDPEALAAVREVAPDLWILAPGVGSQGGDLEQALRAGLRADGMGMLLPVSRSIAQADDRKTVATTYRDQINEVRDKVIALKSEEGVFQNAHLADYLLQVGCVKFGNFTLKSGLNSPIYIDLRLLASYPKLLSIVASAYRSLISDLAFERLAAIPYAALPIGTAISLQSGVPMIYPRKETKKYGTKSSVEGQFEPGAKVIVIDDLVSSGESKFEAIAQLEAADLKVLDIAVLVDREGGAVETLADAGYKLHSVFKLSELLDYWERTGTVTKERVQEVRGYLNRLKNGENQ